MTADEVARAFPDLPPENREAAAEIYSAAEPLTAAFIKAVPREDMQRMLTGLVYNAVRAAIPMIGQK